MKGRSFNQKGNSWYGPARAILVSFILTFGAFLFYVSSKYFDFNDLSGYLSGRSQENLLFFRLAIIIHLLSASLLLFITTFLIFFKIESKYPTLHRNLGKTSIALGLFFLIPSGYYLSFHAMGGFMGKILFLSLTTLTFISLINGYKAAVKRSFVLHQRWMNRFYILLTSALWLRLNMFIFFGLFGMGEWQYLCSALLSWVPQLLIFELIVWKKVKIIT